MLLTKHRIQTVQAPRIAKWFRERGGIAVWKAHDPSQDGLIFTTPLKGPKGESIETLRPHWSTGIAPDRIITNPVEVDVDNPVLFKRFHVAICRNLKGLKIMLTDASTRRLRSVEDQAAKKSNPPEAGSFYCFDQKTQDALVYYIDGTISLAEWMERNPCPEPNGEGSSHQDKATTSLSTATPNLESQEGKVAFLGELMGMKASEGGVQSVERQRLPNESWEQAARRLAAMCAHIKPAPPDHPIFGQSPMVFVPIGGGCGSFPPQTKKSVSPQQEDDGDVDDGEVDEIQKDHDALMASLKPGDLGKLAKFLKEKERSTSTTQLESLREALARVVKKYGEDEPFAQDLRRQIASHERAQKPLSEAMPNPVQSIRVSTMDVNPPEKED